MTDAVLVISFRFYRVFVAIVHRTEVASHLQEICRAIFAWAFEGNGCFASSFFPDAFCIWHSDIEPSLN